MKHLFCSVATVFALASCSGNGGIQTFQNSDGTTTQISFYSDSTVRVLRYPEGNEGRIPDKSFIVLATPSTKVKVKKIEGESSALLRTSALEIELSADGSVSFRDASGNNLLEDRSLSFTERTGGSDKGAYIVSQTFRLEDGEAIYGLGYDQSGELSLRGRERNLVQLNCEDVIPFIHSVKGYGILWDNNSSGTLFKDDDEGMHLTSEVGECSDYYFTYGGSADKVISNYRKLTGHVPMLPLWSYGFWQSRERYTSSDELLDVVKSYRERGIPLDGIIQDWRYWGEFEDWNAMEFLDPGFPDPKKMVDGAHGMDAHIILSVWPSFGKNTKIYSEMAEGGHLYPQYTWPPVANVYDAFSPQADSIFWNHLSGLLDMGFDGWWLDASEPEIWNGKDEEKEFMTAEGSIRKVGNAYPLFEISNVYNRQREVLPDRRVFILTRSVYAGQQRFGAHTWTGDVMSSWDALRAQVPAALNFTLSGNPNFNSDIGGFEAWPYNRGDEYGSAVENRRFRELYVRWMQFGAFCSMMRSHGTNAPREIYLFGKDGEPVYDALVDAVKLRYAFIPYIYSTSWQITSADGSLMRPLMMDFAADRRTWEIGHEFMFGKDVLVAPVVKAQFTPEDPQPKGKFDAEVDFSGTRPYEVYLPAGTGWYDFQSEKLLSGGSDIEINTALSDIPIYVREGSILPIGPDVTHSDMKGWTNLEIRVYPGADGKFTLYEDEGDGYNYEKGAYSTIDFVWNDASSELTIYDRKGSFDGMLQGRNFTVRLVGSAYPVLVEYSGKQLSVRL